MAGYDYTYKKFNNDSARMRQMVEKNKTELLDKATNAGAEVDRAYRAAADESAKLDEILSKAKEGLTGFEELSAKLAEIKKEVAEASAENDQIRAEVEQLAQQLKTVESMGKSKASEKLTLTEEIDKKSKKTAEKLSKHGKKLNGIESDISTLLNK